VRVIVYEKHAKRNSRRLAKCPRRSTAYRVPAEVARFSKWRHQIGYVVEHLREGLLEQNRVSPEEALKPWLA